MLCKGTEECELGITSDEGGHVKGESKGVRVACLKKNKRQQDNAV